MTLKSPATKIFGSKQCAQRVESLQARNQCDYAETHAKLGYTSHCEILAFEHGAALFAGADSPLTQSFGLGFEDFSATKPERTYSSNVEVIEAVEEFYFQRDVAVYIELANLADSEFSTALGEREYKVCEYSHVLGLSLNSEHDFSQTAHECYRVEEHVLNNAGESLSAGFLEFNRGEAEIPPQFLELFQISMRTHGSSLFAVDVEGEIAGAGGITLLDGVAMLSGASTQPKYRNHGVQKALIHKRLAFAREQGCDLAVVSTAPGTVSQENMQKIGFEILYARTKFTRAKP